MTVEYEIEQNKFNRMNKSIQYRKHVDRFKIDYANIVMEWKIFEDYPLNKMSWQVQITVNDKYVYHSKRMKLKDNRLETMIDMLKKIFEDSNDFFNQYMVLPPRYDKYTSSELFNHFLNSFSTSTYYHIKINGNDVEIQYKGYNLNPFGLSNVGWGHGGQTQITYKFKNKEFISDWVLTPSGCSMMGRSNTANVLYEGKHFLIDNKLVSIDITKSELCEMLSKEINKFKELKTNERMN